MSVINFNKARKAKARADRRAQADENAVRHGRTKSERALTKLREDKSKRDHDGHKIE